MGREALSAIRDAVRLQKAIPIDLKVEYGVVYSTLQGNMPVNDRIHGSILDIPVNIRLEYTIMPNTYGSFPVNFRFLGTIGDMHIHGKMPYTMVYSTIAGNYPINTGIDIQMNGALYHLEMPRTMLLGRARGSGTGSGGGKAKRVFAPRFVRGKMLLVDEIGGGGTGAYYETCRPVPSGIRGMIEDIEVDLRFNHTYYLNTSSGRNPINNRLFGFLREASERN